MSAPLLTLIAFAVADGKLAFTVKGPAAQIPTELPSEKGPKGTRIVRCTPDQGGLLYNLGMVTKIDDGVEVGDDAGEFFEWSKHMFPTIHGGYWDWAPEPEPEPEPEPAKPAKKDTKAAKPAKTPEPEPDPDPEPEPEPEPAKKGTKPAKTPDPDPEPEESREDALGKLKAADLKARAMLLHECGFETAIKGKKDDLIKAILGSEAQVYERDDLDELKTVADGNAAGLKAHLKDIDDLGYLGALRLIESEGKNRKSSIAAIDAQIEALKAAEASAVPAVPAPTAPKGKALKALKAPKAPKAPKAKGPSEEDQQASALCEDIKDSVTELLKLRKSGRKARLDLTQLIAVIEEETLAEGNPNGILIQKAGVKAPLGHVPGRIWKATKRHPGAMGTCEYHVECLADGGYKIVHFAGNRTDITVGAEFLNANALLQLLTGRDYPRVQVYKYFNDGFDDSKVK
jgi:hypothetical protein